MKAHARSTNVLLPESSYDKLSRQLNNINNKINDMSPYIESKTAYIGDTSIEFNKAKNGMVNVFINESPCDFEVNNDKIIAHFEELEEIATITVQIQ